MNAPVLLAQLQGNSTPAGAPPRHIKLEKPTSGATVTVYLNGPIQLDFSDIASEKLTFVRLGDKLIVLFDNQSTVTIEPVFGPDGHPLTNVAFEMAPDHMLTGDQFAAKFPITTDQSILPAAGAGGGPTAGAHFSDPTVDALSTGNPLALLGASPAAATGFTSRTDTAAPTHTSGADPDVGAVVAAGIIPTNIPFAGTPVATGNVLANDTGDGDSAARTVVAAGVGSATPSGHVGDALTGTYGTLVMIADGTFTYTLDNANPLVDELAAGQHANDVFSYTMNDGFGHISTTTLTVDVIGADNQPVIAAAGKIETAATPIAENTLVTGDPTHHVETGAIPFTDVDLTDRPTATVVSQAATYTSTFGDEGHKVLTLSPAELAAVENAFTVDGAAGNANNGSIVWTYSVADKALDFLAQGETVTLVSTVQLDDHNGGTDTATVTLTITGSNDLPIVTHVDNGSVTKDFMPTGTVSEIVNGGFETGDLTGWTAGPNVFVDSGAPALDGNFSARLNATGGVDSLFQDVATNPGQQYLVQFTLAQSPDDVTDSFTATWDGSQALLTLVDSLPDGAKTYQFVVNGDPAHASSRLAFDFQDDGTGWVLDDVSVKPFPMQQAAAGTISFSDADLNDIHSVTNVAFVSTDLDGGTGAHIGGLTANMVTDTTGTGLNGVVDWQFAANNADPTFQGLGQEDTVNEVFAVTISDNHGGQTVQEVTVTLHGANDPPVFDQTSTIGGSFSELRNVTGSISAHSASGLLGFTDIDLHDVGYTATIVGEASSGLAVGLPPDLATLKSFLTLGAVSKASGSSTGDVAYSFTAPDDTFDFLPQGESVTLTYQVEVTDPYGASSTENLSFTVTGSNDLPMADTAYALGSENTPNPPSTISPNAAPIAITLNGNDVDYNDFVQSFRLTSLPAHGFLFLDAAMTHAVVANTNYNTFGNPLTLYFQPDAFFAGTVHFHYVATDSTGADSAGAATATIDVAPVADPPVITNGGQHTFTPADINTPASTETVALTGGGFAESWQGNGSTIFTQAFDANGHPVGPLGTVAATGSGQNLLVALNGGGYAIAWVNNANDVFTQAYNADGTPNGVTELVDNNVTGQANIPIGMTALDTGGYAILYERNDNNENVFTRTFSADGAPASVEVHVNSQPPGDGSDNLTRMTGEFATPAPQQLATLGNGDYAVAWSSQLNGQMVQHVRVFDDHGHPVTPAMQVSMPPVGSQGDGGFNNSTGGMVTALAHGDFAVAWGRAQLDGSSEVMTKLYHAGDNYAGTPEVLVSSGDAAGGAQEHLQQITGLANGGYAVLWTQIAGGQADTYVQVYDANGHLADGASADSNGIQVDSADGVGGNSSEQILALPNGRFAVMWQGGTEGDPYVRVFNADGAPVDDGVRINATPGDAATLYSGIQMVAFADGTFAAVYDQTVTSGSAATATSQDHLFVQQFDQNGAAIGSPLELASSPFTGAGLPELSSFDDFRLALTNEGLLVTGGDTHDKDSHAVNVGFVHTATGVENEPIALVDISIPPDPSETLKVTISGFRPGSRFTAHGAVVGGLVGGDWVISDPVQVASLATYPLTLVPPSGFSGDMVLTIDAVSTDTATLSTGSDNVTAETTQTISVSVADVNDATLSNPSSISVIAGGVALPLGIGAPVDPDHVAGEQLIITIQAVPAYGAVQYFDGTHFVQAVDGTVLTAAELESLQYVPPAGGSFHGDSIVYSVQDGPSLVEGSIAINVTPSGGALYFSGDGHTGQLNPDLFTLDSSGHLTSIPVNSPNGSSAGEDGGFVQFANQLYFLADTDGTGEVLFRLGADNLAHPVTDANGHTIAGISGVSSDYTIYDGNLYFIAQGSSGTDLFKIDATGAVTEINVNPGGNAFDQFNSFGLAEFDGKLYFNAYNSASSNFDHTALFEIDPNSNVAAQVKYNGHSLDNAGEDGGFFSFNGGLFFNALDPTSGDSLFKLDANGQPTLVVAGGLPISHVNTETTYFTTLAGNLYLTEQTSSSIDGLFQVTPSGTFAEVQYGGTDSFDFTVASQRNLGGLAEFDNHIYFSADTRTTDAQPGVSNPVLFQVDSSGTAIEMQFGSHPITDAGEGGGFAAFNGGLYFFGEDHTGVSPATALFQIDGNGNVHEVSDPTGSASFGLPLSDAHFTQFDGSLYFEAQTGEGDELVQIDSTGTAHVIDVNPDAGPPTGSSFPGENGSFGVYAPIPTVFGTAGNDHLSGGANTVFIGGTGNDTITGAGAGSHDSAVIDSNFANASITLNAGTVTISSAVGTDTLTSIDRVQFADKGLLIVDPTGEYGYSSVQAAINAATAGDTIWVLPGTYTESTIPVGFSSNAGGLFIDTPNLTLQGVESDGTAITSVTDAIKGDLPTIISGAQTDFGANFFVGPNGDNTVIKGLHLQAGPETDNKLVEIWANNVTVEHDFLDVNIGGTTYSGAIAVYLNDNGTPFTDEIGSYAVTGNILNEGVDISNGVGIPGSVNANQVISNNTFEGTFDLSTGQGRYDSIVLNGNVPGIGWLLESNAIPTILGNGFGDNTTPFLMRGSDISAANLPGAADVESFLAHNGNADTTYAYVLKPSGDLELATRNLGSGPFFSFAVTNAIDTLELALEPAGDNNVFSGQAAYLQSGDTVIIQSGPKALHSNIDVDGLKVQADADSASLTLTLATELPDGTPVTVKSLTLQDYTPGHGANVNVVGNDLGDTIQSDHGTHTITTGSGNDTVASGGGTDTINAGGGNDTIVYNAVAGGTETVDGGSGTDTQVIDNTGGVAETFNINPIDASHLGVNIEPGTNNAAAGPYEISDTHVEEILVHLGSAGDTVLVSGNLGGTGVATSTITVDGGAGNDTVDASGMSSAYAVDVAFTGGGGNDTFKGGPGADTITYNVADGGRETVDGGAGTDTQIISNFGGIAETFNINPIDATHLGVNIVPGNSNVQATAANYEISDTNVEEILIRLSNAGDHVNMSGDLSGTGVATSTITINGGAGDDTVDLSRLTSNEDVVFNGGGTADASGDTVILGVAFSQAAYQAILDPTGHLIGAAISYTTADGPVTDTFTNVHHFQFTDGTRTIGDLFPPTVHPDAASAADTANVDAGAVVASGNAITDVSDSVIGAGVTLSVTAVNGQSGEVGQDIGGQYGTLHLNANGSYSYTANNAFDALTQGATASDVFHYTVSGSDGGSAATTLTFNVTGVDDTPAAVADIVNANASGAASATTRASGVLANDTDRDTGDAATLVVSAVLAGTSGTGLPVTSSAATIAHGTFGDLSINADGTYSYTPNSVGAQAVTQGLPATDVFTYTARDSSGATSNTTLKVVVVPYELHGVEQPTTDEVVFSLIPPTGGDPAVLEQVRITGFPINLTNETTSFVLTDSNGNNIPIDASAGATGVVTLNFDPSHGPVVPLSILNDLRLNLNEFVSLPLSLTTVSSDGSVTNSFTLLSNTPDMPVLTTHNAVGTATVPIPLAITEKEADPHVAVAIMVSGVPAGATLNHGSVTATDSVTGYTTWTINNPADLSTLTLTSDGLIQHFDLKVDATATQSLTTSHAAEATLHVDVAVASEANPILVASAEATNVNEDSTVVLDVNAAPGDATINVTGLKDANGNVIATLNHGTLNADGSVTLHQSDLHNLASPLTLHALRGDETPINLTLTATTPTSVTSSVASIHLVVNPDPAAPTVTASGPTAIVDPNGHTSVAVDGGGLVALSIAPAYVVDPDAVNTVTISGLAGTGATLVHLNSGGTTSPVGTVSTDGNSVTLRPSDLAGLELQAPVANTETFTLQVTAAASEGGLTAVSAPANLGVNVAPMVLQLHQLPGENAAFNIVPVSIDSNAVLQEVIIGGILIDVSHEWTPYIFTDSKGNHLPLDGGVGLNVGNITSQSGTSNGFAIGTITLTHNQLFNPDGSPTGILNDIHLALANSPIPENSPIPLTLTAVSTDGSTTQISAESTFTIVTVPTPDQPVLTEQPAILTAGVTGLLSASMTNKLLPDQTAHITVSGVPADASLSVATHNNDGSISFTQLTANNDGTYTVTQAQLSALALTSTATATENYDLTISATETAGGITTPPTTVTLPVQVNFDPHATITEAMAASASVNEGGTVALGIAAGPFDATVTVYNLGTAHLNHGTWNPDGSVTLTESQLNGLTLTTAVNDPTNLHLTVVATSPTDSSTDAKTIDIAVNPVAEKPTVAISALHQYTDQASHTSTVNVAEGGTVALNISANFATDPDAVDTIVVSGLAGAILNHGTVNPDGSVTLHQSDLAGLTLTAPDTPPVSGVQEVIQLSVTANVQEGTSSATSNVSHFNVDVAPIMGQGVEVYTDTTDRFRIVLSNSDPDATLSSVTIGGLPQNIETDSTNFKLLDSSGNSIPFNGVTFPLSPYSNGSTDFDDASATLSAAQAQDAITNGLQLLAYNSSGAQISLEGQTIPLTIGVTSIDGGVYSFSNTPFTIGIAETPLLQTPAASGTQGTAFALPITVSTNDPNAAAVQLSVSLSGLPTGVSLTDANNDTLLISNGTIALTVAELSGLKLLSDGEDQHFDLTVAATAVDPGHSATTATTTSTLHVDVTPTSSTTTAAAQFDATHGVLNFSNHMIETNTTGESVQLTDGSHAGATLSATGDHFIADGTNELLDLSQWDRGIEIDFNALTVRLDANTQTPSGSLSGFANILGTSHGDWFDNLTGGVTVDGGTSGAVDHFSLAANVLNSGNAPTINNFHVNSEAIDLSALLDTKFGPGSNPANAANFVQLKEDPGGNSATLKINVSGTAGGTYVAAAHFNDVHSGDVLTAILDHAHTQAQIHAA